MDRYSLCMDEWSYPLDGHRRKVMEYYRGIQKNYDDKFEELLIDYLDRKLCIRDKTIDYLRDNYERLGLTGFGIHYYIQGNKKQFVNEITKEVLFEVGIEVGNTLGSNIVWWEVYWK